MRMAIDINVCNVTAGRKRVPQSGSLFLALLKKLPPKKCKKIANFFTFLNFTEYIYSEGQKVWRLIS